MLPKSVWVPPLGSSPWFLLLGSPLGLTYDKNAVEFCPAASVEFCPAASEAFCPAASKVAMITDSVLPDRMDNLLAFGGVLQIELNKFTRRITRQGFSRTWTFLPRVRCRRQREHILARDGRHLKAYAGEIFKLLESMGAKWKASSGVPMFEAREKGHRHVDVPQGQYGELHSR